MPNIYVEKIHKGHCNRENGSMLKEIGRLAREDIEGFWAAPFFAVVGEGKTGLEK